MGTPTLSTLSAHFPLKTVGDVRRLFEAQLKTQEPDLVMLSVVIGTIENTMTASATPATPTFNSAQNTQNSEEDVTPVNWPLEPPVELHLVEALVQKFAAVLRGYCDVNLLENKDRDVRKIIKHVADIVWNTLSKAQYKDRPHLQTIYSYLTGNKLDCFGVAYAVVAACQLLKVPNVHLALSEDHAWVVFGENGTETAEVTWHGKGNEDKRGQPVEIAKAKTSWLYLAGQPVVCDRNMEVAALVSSVNPAINSNMDSLEVGAVQQELLWLLYDMGHLQTYPMALGNLGDLEEISPSLGRPKCAILYEEAILVNQKVYNNQHVYPYTYQAGYFYRTKDYSKALECWANAADVIKQYKYSKDDEEIYKEFMEIANELIPHVVKSDEGGCVTKTPRCFANILRFYDGICCWEEGSATPVLHIGWSKPMVSTCGKFENVVRRCVGLPSDESSSSSSILDDSGNSSGSPCTSDEYSVDNNNYYNYHNKKVCNFQKDTCDNTTTASVTTTDRYNNCDSVIRLLAQSCQQRLLSMDYLLGKSSQPFSNNSSSSSRGGATKRRRHKQSSTISDQQVRDQQNRGQDEHDKVKDDNDDDDEERVVLRLHSAKMLGLKALLCAEKLNTSAIQLQLTAQSQTAGGNKKNEESSPISHTRPKRTRRE